MHIRCPNCRSTVDADDSSDVRRLFCSECGTSFSLVLDDTRSHNGSEPIVLGQFRLLHQVGSGAFGEVWSARDVDLDRNVAIKIPREGLLKPDEAESFLREARLSAGLRHPHIVSIHEIGRDDEKLFIVSELIEGVNLAEWLSASLPSHKEATDLACTLAETLHYAHGRGVIHRDLKPSNIMLDRENQPFVMDFGIAKRDSEELTMTIDGRILGTPSYMSPEQARGESHRADARSDVYSLGVILFELLTGDLPFRGTAPMVLHQKIRDEAPSLRKFNSRIPRDLETICLKCLAREPRKRYETAGELAEDLDRYRRGKPILARPIGRIGRTWRLCKRNPVATAAAGLLMTALMMFAIVLFLVAEKRRRALYISDMNIAARAWDDNNLALAKEILASQVPKWWQSDLRAFEWYWLQHECTKLTSDHVVEFDNVPKMLAMLDDSGQVATAFAYGDIRASDSHFDEQVATEVGPGWRDWRNWCAPTPDGGLLYVRETEGGSGGVELELVERDPTGTTRELARSERPLLVAAHARTSQLVAYTIYVSEHDHSWIHVVDEQGKSLLSKPLEVSRSVQDVVWSDDDGLLVAVGISGMFVWETDSWTSHFEYTKQSRINCAALSPNGELLATGSEDGAVLIFETKNWQIAAGWPAHRDAVRSLVFTESGELVTGGRDNAIHVWHPDDQRDAMSWQQIATLKGHAGIVNSVVAARDQDGERIISASQDYTVRIWDASRLARQHAFSTSSRVTVVASQSDGDTLAITEVQIAETSPGDNGELDSDVGRRSLLWRSIEDGRPVQDPLPSFDGEYPLRTESPHCVALASDKGIRIVDLDSKESRLLRVEDTPEVTVVAVSLQSKRAAIGYSDGRLEWWDFESEKRIELPSRTQAIGALAFDRTGRFLASGCSAQQGEIQVLDLNSATTRSFTLSGHRDSVMSLAFSPVDSNLLVSGSFDNTIMVWDCKSEERKQTLRTHTATVRQVLFSSDARTLLSAGGDRDIRVWDTRSWQQKAVLKGHRGAVYSICWAESERVLVSGSADRTVRLWRTQ